MKPYIPALLLYISPDKKIKIHSPEGKNSFLIRKSDSNKEEKFQWAESFYPAYIFSDPSSRLIISLGGLGDPGISLGEVVFYNEKGKIEVIDLKRNISDFDEIARAYTEKTNFPWITSLEINAQELQIWICNKVLAIINLKNHTVTTSRPSHPPEWAKFGKNFSPQTAKYKWQHEYHD